MKTILDLLVKIETFGIKLKVDEANNLLIRGNKNLLDKTLISEISELKPQLVEYLLQKKYMVIEAVARNDDYKLKTSFAQQRLWLVDQIDGGGAHYNIASYLRLTGSLNIDALRQAFTSILERHESLRTCFIVDERGEPMQIIQVAAAFVVPLIDLSEFDESIRQLRLAQIISDESAQFFDLGSDLMLRAQLIKVAANEHVLLVTMHHIASDGWSMSILINEFRRLYSSFILGHANPLPPLEIQYSDYAHWQRNWLQGEVLDQQLGYWEKQLANLPVVHSLPLDYPRPAIQGFAGKTYVSRIDSAISKVLNDLCQSYGATLFMGLHAVFSVLLSRYSNETDIVVGSPIANREQAEVAGLIGFFANTLVLRSDLSENPGFIELLQQSKGMLLAAYAHQQVPFEQIVERLQPVRSLSHSALFQVMLILQNNEEGVLELPGLTLSPMEQSEFHIAKYDLTLSVTEGLDGLSLSWEYNTDLFEQETIIRMAAHFELLLKALVSNPHKNVLHVEMLSIQERQQLLTELNNTRADYPSDKCIHELFETQVINNPNSIAVIFKNQQLTYEELNNKANQLAHYLIQEKHVKPDTLVGICVERSLEMVVGILAILKAGGAYIPLDPEYPEARLAYMLDDAKLTTVLTQSHLRATTPVTNAQAVHVDGEKFKQQLQIYPTTNPDLNESGLNLNHLAYVIYTSGSTGNPKGVLAPHRSICNRVNWMEQHFPVLTDDVFCQKTAAGFVDHVAEIFQALAYGKCLVIVQTSEMLNIDSFVSIVMQHQVTRLTLVPSLLKFLIEQGALAAMTSLRLVISSGEALPLEQARSFYSVLPNARLLNLYGSSEVGADVSFYVDKVGRDSHRQIPIGKPIANTQLIVLDSHMNLVPFGVGGELHVSGAGLALGYLNNVELTSKKFISNPFCDRANVSSSEYLYKTGDRVRWLPDGNLEFLGRIDHQVKINGIRIELGEVENALISYPQIKDAIVVAREGLSGSTQLVSYVIPQQVDNENVTKEEVTFSLFYFGADATSADNKYDLYLKAAKFADDHGLEAIWTPERHFDPVGGNYPNPALLSAAIATITSRVKLRAGSVVMPLHDPIRVAEEWAVVDNLSNGRVGLAIASGWHTRDFVLAPENFETRRKIVHQGIGTLKTLWNGNKIIRKNGKGNDVEIQVFPKPIQNELPLWITASSNPETFVDAGRLGAHLLTNLLGQTIDELAEKIVLYREALAKNGYDPTLGRVTLMIHTYLGEDLQETLDQAKAPFMNYMRSHISLIIPMLKSLDIATDGVSEADLENMAGFAFERYARTTSFIGTPKSVLSIATRLKDIGVDEFACLIDWIDSASALRALDSLLHLQKMARSLPPSSRSITEYCRNLLPEYMIPTGFVFLDEFPLTPNGKLDRKALPELDTSMQRASYVAPQTETEKMLCEICQEALDIERVGISDNFFQLGGNSLLATRLIARIAQDFGVVLPLRALFLCKDLSEIACVVVGQMTLEKNKRRLEENESKEEVVW
ncbi:MAG: MupA/Atu3671 family FMN-dependent luciferase-like monooxygenase [Pseudomonadota bacterium]